MNISNFIRDFVKQSGPLWMEFGCSPCICVSILICDSFYSPDTQMLAWLETLGINEECVTRDGTEIGPECIPNSSRWLLGWAGAPGNPEH